MNNHSPYIDNRTDEDVILSCSGIMETVDEICEVYVWQCPTCDFVLTQDGKNTLHNCAQCHTHTSSFNKKVL